MRKDEFINIIDGMIYSILGLCDTPDYLPIFPDNIVRDEKGRIISVRFRGLLPGYYADMIDPAELYDMDLDIHSGRQFYHNDADDVSYLDIHFGQPTTDDCFDPVWQFRGVVFRTVVGIVYGIYKYGWDTYNSYRLPPADTLYPAFYKDNDIPRHLRDAVSRINYKEVMSNG